MKSSKIYKILFVCLGNICRSPAAEGIMSDLIKKEGLENSVIVDSAGTSGYHNGDLPDPRMRRHGKNRGYNFDSTSRKFRVNDFDNFDLIITMDDSNYDNVLELSPDLGSQGKVHRMVDYVRGYGYDHIPDPYYSGVDGFELVLDLLEDGCVGLLEEVKTKIKSE